MNFEEPKFKAALMFARRDDEILLILKKRGIGAGLWNGPGGYREEGESPLETAHREFREEVAAEAGDAKEVGVLDFFMPKDDFSMRVWIFVADGIRSGTPTETEEARSKWFNVNSLPWGEMWMDDRIWLPHVLAGRVVKGIFAMDGRDIVRCEMEWAE